MNDDGGAEMRGQLLVTLETSVAHSQRLVWGVAAPDLLPRVAVDGHEEPLHIRRAPEVNKGEAGTNVAVLLARHVEEGELVVQSALLKELEEILAGARAKQVADHEGGPLVLATPDLLGIDVELREVLVGDLRAQWPVGRRAATRLAGGDRAAAADRSATDGLRLRHLRALGRGVRAAARAGEAHRGCLGSQAFSCERRGAGLRLAEAQGAKQAAGTESWEASEGSKLLGSLPRQVRRRRPGHKRRGAAARDGAQALGGAHVVKLHQCVPSVHADVGDLAKLVKATADPNLRGKGGQVHDHGPKVVLGSREKLATTRETQDRLLSATDVKIGHENAFQNGRKTCVQPGDVSIGAELLDGLVGDRQNVPGLIGDANGVGELRLGGGLGACSHRRPKRLQHLGRLQRLEFLRCRCADG
mmetsp:Transcript_13690/g.39428  ORF Transcript_13690/g.39428 Transcript_13690/m.39428 type:complete len:416 (-) Transcript_13690:155-1402(-)